MTRFRLSASSRFIAAALLLSCLALPAQAGGSYGHRYGQGGNNAYDRNNNDHHDHGRHHGWSRNRYHDDGVHVIYQSPYPTATVTHTIIRPNYVEQTYSTPVYIEPGYNVGQRLVTYRPVPQHCLTRLGPPPRGYYYSMAGRNVVMASRNDNIINGIFAVLGW